MGGMVGIVVGIGQDEVGIVCQRALPCCNPSIGDGLRIGLDDDDPFGARCANAERDGKFAEFDEAGGIGDEGAAEMGAGCLQTFDEVGRGIRGRSTSG